MKPLTPLKRYNLYLPTTMINRLERQAKKSYTSVSQLVRNAIDQHLAKIEKGKRR